MEERMIDSLLYVTRTTSDIEDAPIARVIKDFIQGVHPSALAAVLNRLHRMYGVAQVACPEGIRYLEEDKLGSIAVDIVDFGPVNDAIELSKEHQELINKHDIRFRKLVGNDLYIEGSTKLIVIDDVRLATGYNVIPIEQEDN